jgi:hypothetical protein
MPSTWPAARLTAPRTGARPPSIHSLSGVTAITHHELLMGELPSQAAPNPPRRSPTYAVRARKNLPGPPDAYKKFWLLKPARAAEAICVGRPTSPLCATRSRRGSPRPTLAILTSKRKGRQARPLCRLPDGRGRHPTADVPGDYRNRHQGHMKRSIAIHSTATDGRSTSKCQAK